MYSLEELFKDSDHKGSLFSGKAIQAIESSIFMKTVRGVDVPYIQCLVRHKDIKLTPEEAVRQLYVYTLVHQYGYSVDQMELERHIHFGREVKRADIVIIDKKTFHHPHMKRSHLKRGDVLLSIVGTVGKSAIVSTDADATCSCKLAIMRNSKNGIMPEVLLTFIKTEYGQNQIQKFKRGAVQTGLLLEDFDQLFIPNFSADFQEFISVIINKSHEMTLRGNTAYLCAHTFLLNELRFDSSSLSLGGIARKRMSESFSVSGRLDAEYYQPKYESIQRALNATDTVQTLCRLHDRTFLPNPREAYRYIELADVGNSGFIADVESQQGIDLPSRARRRVKRGQVIVSSVEGSLQSCALITDEYDNALCSTGFYVVDSEKINAETLLVLFKSEPMQALMKQRCSGTILTAISKDEFLSMPLPFIGDDIQREIAQKVRESFFLRRQAETLIETAVKAVEIAIEQDEAAAVTYMEQQSKWEGL